MVEEVEWIHTSRPVLRDYSQIVEEMLKAQSNSLYAGRLIVGVGDPAGGALMRSEVRRVPVRSADAARLFLLNMRSWKDNLFVRDHHSEASIARLEAKLAEIAQAGTAAAEIEWGMHQAVFRRA